jgi:TolB-like protein
MRLAMDLAMPLVQSRTTAEFWANAYNRWLSQARSFDAQEGSVQRVVTSTFKNARL